MVDHEQHRRLPRTLVAALAVLLVVAGAIALIIGIRAQKSPPQPPAAAAASSSSAPARPATGSATPGTAKASQPAQLVKGPILKPSTPVELDIPAIGVSSDLLQLGLNPDRTVQVPPLGQHSQAGWYRESPAPGQLGPSLILGHVDSAQYGPGVFFRLGALRPGDQLTISRADRTVAVFRIDRVVSYPKSQFPTYEVYGNTDHAALRLVTCGGKFDFSKHSYESNIVAYASLIGSHPA